MKIKQLVRKNLDILLSALICFAISGSIISFIGFFKIKEAENKLEREFFSVNQSRIEEFLQKIDVLPDILFESAEDESRCKEKIKALNNNEFYRFTCRSSLVKESGDKNNLIIYSNSKNRAYNIVTEVYTDIILSHLKEIYSGIELGIIKLSYRGKDFILQNRGRNIKEAKICISKNTCLVWGYSSVSLSKIKSAIFKEYLIILLLIEMSFVLSYLIFKKSYRYFVFTNLSKSNKTLLDQIITLNNTMIEQQLLIKELKEKEKAFNNSASFQVTWMSLLNKNLKELLMKIAFKEKDNFELNSFLLSLIKKGDMIKIYPQEVKDNILQLGSYIALSSQLKIIFTIKQYKMIKIYIHEMVFLNIVYSLAYNVVRNCMAKSKLYIEIDTRGKKFKIIFTGSIMNIKNGNHPVFENFNKIKLMIAEAGGNLIIKMVLSEQRVTLDFPIGYKLEENSKIIKLQDVISKKGGNANN
jgi:hypothetical protein